jgi:hypothetical protein
MSDQGVNSAGIRFCAHYGFKSDIARGPANAWTHHLGVVLGQRSAFAGRQSTDMSVGRHQKLDSYSFTAN